MNILVELMVAVAILGLALVPLFGLASSNVNRCGFTLERKEAHHLAWALVERYRGEGLPDLLRRATQIDGRWILEDAHETDVYLRRVLTSRLEGRGVELSTRVEYDRKVKPQGGLGCLRCVVAFTRKGRTIEVTAARLFPTGACR